MLIIPVNSGYRGSNRDASSFLDFVEVHRCSAISTADFANPVDLSGVEKHPFGQRRFPGIDMSRDPDVTKALDRDIDVFCHSFLKCGHSVSFSIPARCY
jgi:hypothetical protein